MCWYCTWLMWFVDYCVLINNSWSDDVHVSYICIHSIHTVKQLFNDIQFICPTRHSWEWMLSDFKMFRSSASTTSLSLSLSESLVWSTLGLQYFDNHYFLFFLAAKSRRRNIKWIDSFVEFVLKKWTMSWLFYSTKLTVSSENVCHAIIIYLLIVTLQCKC